jgi:ATP/maltotriose-dependent transcriptional regulator MalT
VTGRSGMHAPPIELKLAPPPTPRHHITRPRVTACFSAGDHERLTLVTGPPGSGKTTAVQEWLHVSGRRAAWLTLDTDDNAAPAFWRDVLTAVRHVTRASPDRGSAKEAAARHPSLDHVLAEVDALDDELVLVLDDFHLVHARSVLGDVQHLLERKPTLLHVVVVSRSDPALPVARWRVRDELVEIREADLRFDAAEAGAYLGAFEDLHLDDHAVATLARRTEGWIAGLQLAVISLRASDDSDSFIESFGGTDRFIADFLLDEVLAGQPEEVREFLLLTSVLPRFDAQLCETVTGRPDADAQLRRLEAANLFLVRADPAGTSFRYHSLFRDLLRSELETRDPERGRAARAEAAWQLARADDTRAAVELLVAAGKHEEAFSLALPRQAELTPTARVAASSCLDLLPVSFVSRDRERSLLYADALRKIGRQDDAAVWLERASVVIGRDGAATHEQGRAEALWAAWYAAEGDAHASVHHADRARRIAIDADPSAVGDRTADGVRLDLARAWLLLGNFDRARRSLAKVSRDLDPVVDEVAVPAVLARLQAGEGRLRDAEVSAERSLRMAGALDVAGHPATMDALLARAALRRERDDLTGAARDVDEALALADDLASPPYRVLTRLEQVRNVEAIAGPQDALEHLRAVRAAFGDPRPPALLDATSRVDVRLSMRSGDLTRASLLAATLPVGIDRELMLAGIEVGEGRSARARRRLAALQPVHLADRIRYELLRGTAAERIVDLRRHVTRAAELAAPEGFRRTFIECGPGVSRALRSLATSARLHPMTIDLVRAVVDLPALGAGEHLLEPLSEREESVLRYFPTMLSYHDIATELLISINTLKTHVRSIHRKLGVTSRGEAIRRAQALGMLKVGRSTQRATG